jgi:hypothetical protein
MEGRAWNVLLLWEVHFTWYKVLYQHTMHVMGIYQATSIILA